MILFISPKGKYATKRIIEEAGKLGLEIKYFDIEELAAINFDVDVNRYSFLYVRFAYPYFAQIVDLAKKFHQAGKYIVDGNAIIKGFETSKKYLADLLKQSGIQSPKIYAEGEVSYPCVVKWQYGFNSNHVHLVKDQNQFDQIISRYPKDEIIIQEYIRPDYEYMVMCVGYKSLPVILRFQVNSNGLGYDKFKYSILKTENHPEIASLSEKASKVTGFELSKVDIIEKDKQLYVLEVNRSPSLLPFEPYSKLNIAKELIIYLSRIH